MRVFINELKSLLSSPMLIVFIALCFCFNVFFIMNRGNYDYADYVAEASRTTGYWLDAEFESRIAELEPGELRDFLKEDTTGMSDIFDGYETASIAEAYIDRLGLSGYAARALQNKYADLQDVVDVKATTNESMTLYFASATGYRHDDLYSYTMLYLVLQCALTAALIMLISLGLEHHNRTSHVVYTTKTGRSIIRYKLLASLVSGQIAFAVLTVLTLAVYFTFNDYGAVWGSSISSGFNLIDDMLLGGTRPFMTWQSYTVLTYLLTILGVSAALMLCFSLMAFVIGIWLKNSYIGFLVFIVANSGCVVFAIVVSGLPQYLAVLSPIWLWIKQAFWLTDGGADILWKNFEMLGISVSLLMLAALCVCSAILFRRRDIA